MPGGGSKAPTPDPAIGEAAMKQAELGEDWLSFAKDAFTMTQERQAQLDELTRPITEQQIQFGEEQLQAARDANQRYKDVFQPIEDQFVQDASTYGSPERQAEAAAEAKADVQSAAAGEKAAAQRQATSMGLNPNSGRFAAIDRAGELGTALATADAENKARRTVRDTALGLKADVVNLGRGLPAQSAQAGSLGLTAGRGAVALNQGNQQLAQAAPGIVNSGFGGAMAGYQGQAGTLTGLYNSQLNAWNTQQQNNNANTAAIGNAIGNIVGYAAFASDKDIKTGKKKIAKGKSLEMVKEMPVEQWRYKPGLGDPNEHVGTYAQDFQAATGSGDGKTIPYQDAIGITMGAVKDLAADVDALKKQIGLGDGERRMAA